MEGLAVR